ncbi:MAG: AMP-binding protein, partial [Eggerthellaceae bacterium]|nr:AMP-binding protein [Eggerthellaceae bacterium]
MRNINLRYVNESYNELGQLETFAVNCPESFNFGYDVVDDIAENDPQRRAMIWCNPEGEEHFFSFADMKLWSDKTANFLAECGIGRGDMVMVILRRHYQFWFVATALHKLGAVIIPATFMLKEHDLEYRLNGAGVKALIVTDVGEIAEVCDKVSPLCPSLETKILVNAGSSLPGCNVKASCGGEDGAGLYGEALSGPEGICAAPALREGWIDFNSSVRAASGDFARRETRSAEAMLMYFSSGTSGNPKMVLHDSAYALAHLMTAKHWHNVEPDGVHFTIADTGWGKAVWGKFYGQWLMEACVLTYDYDRFVASELLGLIPRYKITSFCCPPTMFRMLMQAGIDDFDLSSLNHLTTAGEALNPDIFEFWLEHTGLTIYEGFGQTETVVSIGNLTNSSPRSGSMGKPVPLYQVEVLRADASRCN